MPKGAARSSSLGHVSGGELHDLVRGARAVVLPSEMRENAPLAVLEAFALGKPVAGARIGGIPELVDEGRTGWTFPSCDAEALAQVMAMVSTMPDVEVESVARTARQRSVRN